jgi:hypothetical protein
MRSINKTSLLFLILSVTVLASSSPAIAKDPMPSASAEEIAQPATSSLPQYGPILAQDPATRAHIRDLYLEQNYLSQDTKQQLQALNQTYANETNMGIRQQLSAQMRDLKVNHEVRNIELGLEIARLNGQQQRVEEYELALDQIQNPENYLPTNRPDPAVKAARIREQGQK